MLFRSGRALEIGPVSTPLAKAIEVALRLPAGLKPAGVGLYLFRDARDGWEYIGATHDATAGTIGGGTRHLGLFSLMRDTRAPRITLAAIPRAIPAAPYPRWAIEAPLADQGSGVDARESYFIVDGRRCPGEWDSAIETLRWRPLRAPSRGSHTVAVVATDRAGNARRTSGVFVLN